MKTDVLIPFFARVTLGTFKRDSPHWISPGLPRISNMCGAFSLAIQAYGGSPLGGTRLAQGRGAPLGGTSSPGTSSGGTRSLAQGYSSNFKVAICPELSVMTIYFFY